MKNVVKLLCKPQEWEDGLMKFGLKATSFLLGMLSVGLNLQYKCSSTCTCQKLKTHLCVLSRCLSVSS